jgi:regulator of sigma E protease
MGIQFAQLLLTLTILIVLHEWGHFYFAKRFKCRVEKFYLFFDFLFPISTLLKFSLFKIKKGETEYGIGWFPLGGYVQIAGMVDEQMDAEHLNKPPQPWEFRAKPRWQRLLIMLGGIIMNVIVGIFIYWMLILVNGKEILPVNAVKEGVACDSVMLSIGFRDGDKILTVDNKQIDDFNKIPLMIILDKAKTVQIDRDGNKMDIPITDDHLSKIVASRKAGIFSPRFKFLVDSTDSGSEADRVGMRKGDRIIKINDVNIEYFHEFRREIARNNGKKVKVTLVRNNDSLVVEPAIVADKGTIGVYTKPLEEFETKKIKFGVFSSLTEGIKDGWRAMVLQAKNIGLLFTVKDAYKQLGGFYTMSKVFDKKWDWQEFWSRCAMISLMLAFMNFLPIPMLDGGYILFLLIEMITRRNIPEKFILYANYVGLVFIMALMIYANTDWLRF